MWPILQGFGPSSSTGSAPNTPVLTVSDNANGTATATIASSTSGSANIVYTRELSASTWTSSGSRTGNGTVTLTLANGAYDGYVKSTVSGATAASVPVRFRVTSGVDAVWEQVLTAVHEKIADLAPSGISVGNIVIRKVPTTADHAIASPKYPCIIISPYRSETITTATTLRDDITYPVLVAIVANDALSQSNRDTYLKWREDIRRTLEKSTFTIVGAGTGDNYRINVSPMPALAQSEWSKGMWVSLLVANAVCREHRTVS